MGKVVYGLPNVDGSVDGGKDHGTIFAPKGPLGLPLTLGALCMFVTTMYFYVKSLSAAQEAKKFYYVSLSVTGIATVAYLCMRANIGIAYVECAGHNCPGGPYKALQSHGGMSYPLFWMRYVDWFFTTPFFLLDLCILANACPWETFFVMLMNAICIACGAIGALKPSVNVPTFILGMVTFVAFIQRLVVLPGDAHYQMVMKLTMGIWCAYPIMFLVCEMTHMVATPVEVWMYCILDVAAKCGCGFLLVNGHTRK